MPGADEQVQNTTQTQESPPEHTNETTTGANSNGNGGSKFLTIPTSKMAVIKQDERTRERKRVLEEREAEAKSLGFASYEEMKTAAQRSKQSSAAPASSNGHKNGNGSNGHTAPSDERRNGNGNGHRNNGAQPPSRREFERLMKERQDSEERLKKMAREKAQAEKRRRMAERERDEKDAEMALRVVATRKGITDVDYAMELARRAAPRRRDGEDIKAYHTRLAEFDEEKFFDGLREKHPYLFQEVARPATTGNSGNGSKGGPPPAPGPKQVTNATAQGNTPDARSVSQEDYDKMLQQRGLKNPSRGSF